MVTDRFTMLGKVRPETFQIETAFGPLSVAIKDIRHMTRDSGLQREKRVQVALTERDVPQRQLRETGLRLNRGDRVTITASGKLLLTPWNNTATGPEGAGHVFWYTSGIGAGALIGRIGPTGQEFLVGARKTFEATRSGMLYLGVGIPTEFADQGYNFPGQFEARVRVLPMKPAVGALAPGGRD